MNGASTHFPMSGALILITLSGLTGARPARRMSVTYNKLIYRINDKSLIRASEVLNAGKALKITTAIAQQSIKIKRGIIAIVKYKD